MTPINSTDSYDEQHLNKEELIKIYESKKLPPSCRTECNLKQLLRYALSMEDMDYEMIEFCSKELEKIIPRDPAKMQQVYDNLIKKIHTYN